ncbi:DNA-directed RNA polymerases IV and V subunit 4-like [Prunus avium]|uniref:DNA-directed RNA polymerases IV and V subunit 4-like n=1 Tax=Prunus avium TaxID=42229 RepID=A0A6P5TM28_PRUAV|nr:DNA-directed RNA polymerases IV and V subunit 4-like [Prunus avium]XP_021828104.1 DNA-directed RNA polymerases IV and V subunit 4-like [Prunus avium]XP_021828105.1 DNA-directed RNA polymerases IV and V subunit 4-like [Prunus avium]XP_021828106.1 DNA-directed RNA polymerases IV and V subunit 4-like [Prunus avium]
MSEKGGKGFSLPTGKAVKSSLKSTPSTKDASLKGKDDSSTKSKKGRKVQFDSEGLHEPKSNFSSKFDNPAAASGKADWGKGGKGDKVGNGRKKEPQPLELKIEQELPQSAKCLMDCEAADILQGIQEQMILLSKDPSIKIPVSFDKGLQYAKRTSHYTNPQSVRKVLEALTKYGVSDGEISVIANVCPETADEVFALVPSLKTTRSVLSQPLKEVLSELTKLKQST